MRKIVVELISDKDASEVAMVEGRRPGQLDMWLRVDGKDIIANKGKVEFNLDKGQRLVIGDNSDEELVYDAEQAAAVRKSSQKNELGVADSALAGPSEADVEKMKQEEARKKAELNPPKEVAKPEVKGK